MYAYIKGTLEEKTNSFIVIENNGLYTIIFWCITILMFIWGNYIFKKSKKDFADVL